MSRMTVNAQLTFSNILHRPMRTFVSVLGIALGVLLIIFTIGLADGTLRGNAQREANVGAEIMVRSSGSFGLSGTDPFRLPVSRVTELAKIDGVKMVVPLGQNLDAADDTETGTRLIDGVNYEEYERMAGLRIVDGRKIGVASNEALIDTVWQAQKKLQVGSILRIYEKDFTVVGTYEPPSGARIKIPLRTMQETLTGETNKLTAVLVKVADAGQQEAVAESISQRYPNDQIILTRDFEELYFQAVPVLDVFLNVVVGVAMVISTLVILLTMYTTVTERTRQIGILKALGMSKAGIAWTITQEAFVISFLGVVLGVISAILLRLVLRLTASSMEVSLDLELILLTFLGVHVGGVIGALYPAIRAAQLDAVEALSYE